MQAIQLNIKNEEKNTPERNLKGLTSGLITHLYCNRLQLLQPTFILSLNYVTPLHVTSNSPTLIAILKQE